MILNMKTKRILDELKSGLTELYGSRFKAMYVYGSYARGSQRPSSDLDVVYILDDFEWPGPEIQKTNALVTKLSLDLEVTISLIPMKQADLQQRFGILARSVAREGIAV